jgi:hypothetical protein
MGVTFQGALLSLDPAYLPAAPLHIDWALPLKE